MRHGFVAILVVGFATSGFGAEKEPSGSEAARLADEAIAKLKSKGLPGFLDVAFAERTGLKAGDRSKGEAFFTQLRDTLISRYGKPTGDIQPVRTSAVGQSLVRFTYLEKMERGAVVWYITFYRGEGGVWRWAGFNMGDQVAAEFRPVKPGAIDAKVLALAQEAADGLKDDGVTKLLDALYVEGRSLIPVDRRQAEPKFIAVRAGVTAHDGKPLGAVELVGAEAIGDSLVRFSYLEKHERGGPVWKFTAYRTEAGWKWQNADIAPSDAEFSAAK